MIITIDSYMSNVLFDTQRTGCVRVTPLRSYLSYPAKNTRD